jgi:hypothetical protein
MNSCRQTLKAFVAVVLKRVAVRFECDELLMLVAARVGYGARFPTEIYTRGCHWIPRMFA